MSRSKVTYVLLFLLLGIVVVVPLWAQDDEQLYLPVIFNTCWPSDTPAAALPDQPPPVFCQIVNQGPGTSVPAENAWHDEFDHGLSFATFAGTNYEIFETYEDVYKTIHWRHANHWMVDLAPRAQSQSPGHGRGGTMMRPKPSFRFEKGKLIVETEFAAGHQAYGQQAWGEIIVSTGDHPEGYTPGNSTYGYDMFPSDWTIGCRLTSHRHPICALKDNTGDVAKNIGNNRIWEMSWFQQVGTEVYGGNEFGGRGDYWRVCEVTDPDILCRDRFRLEITRTSLTLYANGLKYFEQKGIPPLPDALIDGDVYVYFASMDAGHTATTIRYHWDRAVVNSDDPPSAAPNFDPPPSGF